MQDVGEFLERLGRQLGRMERRYGRFGERVGWHSGDDDPWPDEDEAGGDEQRELTFGEQPELRLKANLTDVTLRQVEAGGRARIESRRRGLGGVDIATTEDGAVDVRVTRGFFDGPQRLTIYLPAGTRVRANADAGRLTAEDLTNAELDLRTEAGRLQIRNCHGRMRLGSAAARVDVEACSGALEAGTDAGKIQVRDFAGSISARANAGSIRCSGLRLEPGEHQLEAALGSIDLALVPDVAVPVHIEARASLGSVRNAVGEGPADAPARLRVRTELGSIRIRYDEGRPTPLHRVPLSDEREAGPSTAAAPEPQPRQTAAAPDDEAETLRVLGMVERHEISAEEGATLLAALRR